MKAALFFALFACSAIVGALVLMISIDGMRPDSVTHARLGVQFPPAALGAIDGARPPR